MLIESLSPNSYPDTYNPTVGNNTVPYKNLILSVSALGTTKTITAEQVSFDEPTTEDGKRFVNTCNSIVEILTATNEWKSLPDFPYAYD